jgi:hypothetical protein
MLIPWLFSVALFALSFAGLAPWWAFLAPILGAWLVLRAAIELDRVKLGLGVSMGAVAALAVAGVAGLVASGW